MAKKHRIEIAFDECKGCGRCIAACPKKLLSLGCEINKQGYTSVEASDPASCIGCGACESRCPYDLPIREMLKKCAADMA